MAAIITRTRRLPDDELPKVLSDADLLAWGQSLGDVHVDEWTPDPGAADEEAVDAVEAHVEVEGADAVEVADAVDEAGAGVAPVVEAEAAEVAGVVVDVDADAEVNPVVEVLAPVAETPVTEPEAELTVEPVAVVAGAEPASPVKPARISRRRRELVALRQHLAAQAEERKQVAELAAQRPATRREPLHGYRPDPLGESGTATAWSQASEARTRLQERLAKVTPVARAHDGQWAAHDDAPRRAVAASGQVAAVIRVRLADAD